VYYRNREWWLYRYYVEMGGERLVTEAWGDLLFDVFETKGK
jgi:hypothetical protein